MKSVVALLFFCAVAYYGLMKKFGAMRVFLLILLVLTLSIAPTFALVLHSKQDIVKERLFGGTSELEGVLVVWNVDTFEGGNTGKAVVLEKIARKFENQNKGLFVLVENLSVEQFLERKNGVLPDVISFGSGIFEQIEPIVEPNACVSEDLLLNVRNSVSEAETCKVFPWCM
ncbi:MAG: hypothetical protein IKC47_04355, partial [Clostridia bacterium]|nr:hypothetical protein [Clostridia bacterium]